MPCLSGRYDVNIGPMINVGVTPTGALTSSSPTTPHQISTYAALIDTGASSTCISPDVATALGLQPIGKRPMTSASHTVPANVYIVDLVLPFGKAGLIRAGMQVMEFACPTGSPYQMLLGRDVICTGLFTISFDGHFTFCL